ncbi:hypothetical protein T492DRAFT_1044024 [Pavlovales sp. CCMP2436]|nr:hypothetical protein T492DRAFT_1044024 [Pavlovales sp. CCMP2436]
MLGAGASPTGMARPSTGMAKVLLVAVIALLGAGASPTGRVRPSLGRGSVFVRPRSQPAHGVMAHVEILVEEEEDEGVSVDLEIMDFEAPDAEPTDAQPIEEHDVEGLVAVGSAAFEDAVDGIADVADALAQSLIDFKGSDRAKEASAYMGTAQEAITELLAIAQLIADSVASKRATAVNETGVVPFARKFSKPGHGISEALTNAAAAAFLASLRALAIVLRDVVLSPEVSENALAMLRDGAKAAGAFGRAALQRLDGGEAERERKATQQRAKRQEPEGDVVDPQWVQKKKGAFGSWEIVDSSRKRARRQQQAVGRES